MALEKKKQEHYLNFSLMIVGLLLITTILFGVAIAVRSFNHALFAHSYVGFVIIVVSLILMYLAFWHK